MLSSKKQGPVVVLDSNVWVSAVIWGGKPAKLVRLAERNAIVIAISGDIVDEIRRILSYEKLESIYAPTGITLSDLVAKILSITSFVKPRKRVNVVKEDPSDNRVIECALAARAGHIVTGDDHLLRTGSYSHIAIVSVSDFLKEMKSAAGRKRSSQKF